MRCKRLIRCFSISIHNIRAKGLLRLDYQGHSSTGVFSPEKANQQFILSAPNKLGQFLDYGREGVWHIWIGFDYILFLLARLLPAVAFCRQREWRTVDAFKPARLCECAV